MNTGLSGFKEAQASADPQTILLAEYTFITQELQFCEKIDKPAINSLSRAIRFFDDAFLAVKVVESAGYKEGFTREQIAESKVKIGYRFYELVASKI